MDYSVTNIKHHIQFLIILLIAPILTQLLHATEIVIAEEPSWINISNVQQPDSIPFDQLSKGLYYLLLDKQNRLHKQSVEKYEHLAVKTFNQEGVEEIARVSINFDPTYQTLFLHKVNVIRGNKVFKQLNKSNIKVIQRETELEYQIYDGTKTATLILDDVRVGDIVEYSYTIKGSNPVFAGNYFGGFETQWDMPLYQLKLRLLWPQNRKLYIKYHNQKIEPKITHKAGQQDYRWFQENIPGILSDGDLPKWYDPYPWIQFSELADWKSVVEWALPLYGQRQQLSPALENKISEIANNYPSNTQKVERVLRILQDEVRYMGIELGSNSHEPTAPNKVYERRYGDCKDKSLLMLTMLNKLGIKSEPVLVNTQLKRGIKNFHPTPGAFNHVLVKTTVNGVSYWLDPTQLYQTSNLKNISQPDYGYALVLAEGNDALLPMKKKRFPPSRKTIIETYDLRKGVNQEASYKVKTIYEGFFAERMRGSLETTSRQETQKNYLNYYAHYFPTVKVEKDYTINENREENRIEVTEYYKIPEFWLTDEKKNRVEARFYPPEIEEYINTPKQKIRTMPMKLQYPLDIKVKTHVYLPESWPIKKSKKTINGTAFFYENKIHYTNKHLILTYHFKTLQDHLLPENINEYTQKIKRVKDDLSYMVYKKLENGNDNDSKTTTLINADEINWPIMVLGVLLTLIYIVFAVLLFNYKPNIPQGKLEQSYSHLEGIRGWLILPAIIILLQPFRIMYDMYGTLDVYAISTWTQLTTSTSDVYNALWAPYLLITLASNLALAVFAILLLLMFYTTKIGLPRVYIAFMAFSLVMHTMDLLGANMIPAAAAELSNKDTFELIKLYLVTSIWIAYFSVSKRVRATFIR